MEIEDKFIEKFGGIGENYDTEDWHIRLGFFSKGWESALESGSENTIDNKTKAEICSIANEIEHGFNSPVIAPELIRNGVNRLRKLSAIC